MFTFEMSSESKPRQRAAHQLPPGRHGLSRDFVEANQRERILDAVADVTSLVGYASMSVEDIISAAGVSRRTFYDNFKSKEDAFLTAYEEIGSEAFRRVRAAYAGSDTFAHGVIACLAEFLEFAAAEPRYADMCIVEVLVAGQAAIERRNSVMKVLAELLHAGAQTIPGAVHPPALVAETIIGGMYEIIYSRVLEGRTAELVDLLPELAYAMMLPYLGHEVAQREVASARPTTPSAPAP